jgi:hypothetical protein
MLPLTLQDEASGVQPARPWLREEGWELGGGPMQPQCTGATSPNSLPLMDCATQAHKGHTTNIQQAVWLSPTLAAWLQNGGVHVRAQQDRAVAPVCCNREPRGVTCGGAATGWSQMALKKQKAYCMCFK